MITGAMGSDDSDPLTPTFPFGKPLQVGEAAFYQSPYVGLEDQPASQAPERSKWKAEVHFVFEHRHGSSGHTVSLAHPVIVAKERKPSLLLRILKPGNRLTQRFGVQFGGKCRFGDSRMGINASCDQRVMLCG